VIVNAGAVVAVASTAEGGRPHAETLALDMAGDAGKRRNCICNAGTLQPSWPHTAMCRCLAFAGVGRVVTAIDDPGPPGIWRRTCGACEKAGIEVTEGVLADQVRDELAGYLSRHLNNRPQVILKLAVSADGKIAAERGKPTRITGPEVKARVHLMRSRADAIMVGVSTVLADNPELTCRLPGLFNSRRCASYPTRSCPFRCIAGWYETADEVPVWVMTTNRGFASA
jgi:diaminohydroxyphosphoribosylaminopyrimidine deaminase/5-amino-6-(5-phosphoribosylamino)uracil reductase